MNFGSPNDLVNVLIGFAAVDKTSHLKILKELASLLSIPGFVEESTNVRYSFEVKEIIRKYFNEVKKKHYRVRGKERDIMDNSTIEYFNSTQMREVEEIPRIITSLIHKVVICWVQE